MGYGRGGRREGAGRKKTVFCRHIVGVTRHAFDIWGSIPGTTHGEKLTEAIQAWRKSPGRVHPHPPGRKIPVKIPFTLDNWDFFDDPGIGSSYVQRLNNLILWYESKRGENDLA